MRENVNKSYCYNPEGLTMYEFIAGLNDCVTDYPGIGEILLHVHTELVRLQKYSCVWLFKSKVNSIFFVLKNSNNDKITIEILPTGEVIVRPRASDLYKMSEEINNHFIMR